ncbi:hypothetical protein BGZ61DRAFT_541227 [Ilyonectria robusta]|uniref:uncharacterized protein n=1 Tax=Ilyonectria robusta TaxID=1079257 RepID=UPI001E8D8AD2|nr:uncharacterized protein BGZ61DRAFT_541227 [Ilyonectria robusta]KAH8654886.1 hypothetical protein BGZ61DRAFT_541227 [Ilyonectria robusta]
MAGPPPLGQGYGQTSLNALGVQFFSSLEGLEVITSADRQLIRGHNLAGAVRLQFVRPAYFDDEGGEHAALLDGQNDIDIPLSMHVYPFPDIEEWDGQWFFFDVQLHPYELHFRRKVVDGDESVVGSWEDLYGKLAQVRGQMCLQPVAERSLRHAGGCFPTIAPRASFQGPIDTTTFRFKAGSLSEQQLKCCGFVQCQTYLAPPRDNETPLKGGQAFHILAYMPYDQQPWKSRIGWMKNSAEGGFVSRKWVYGRGSIIGVLNVALLEKEPEPGQDILVVLVDEFGFTSRATFDGGGNGSGLSPQKPRQERVKGRSPFSSSPVGPSSRRPSVPSSARTGKVKERSGGEVMKEAELSPIAKRLFGSQQDSTASSASDDTCGAGAETEASVTVATGSEENEAPIQGRNSLKRGASSGRDGTPRKRVSSWKVQDAQET